MESTDSASKIPTVSSDDQLNRLVIDWREDGEYEFEGRRFTLKRPQNIGQMTPSPDIARMAQ